MNRMARLDAVWVRILTLLALLAAVLVGFMVAVICADVLMRNFKLGNLPWSTEVAEYTLYLSTFLAAPWLLRQGAHVRMDLLIKSLPPTAGWVLELVADVIGLFTCAAMTYSCTNAALASAAQNSLIFKILVFPEWWLIASANLMFGALTIECLCRLQRQFKGPKRVREEATSVA